MLNVKLSHLHVNYPDNTHAGKKERQMGYCYITKFYTVITAFVILRYAATTKVQPCIQLTEKMMQIWLHSLFIYTSVQG
jgi:hypothetical protein